MSHNIIQTYQNQIENKPLPKGQKKVLIAAIELFSQQGFDGTSTAQIAEKAGVSQATIFKYFKTKDQLLLESLEAMTELLQEEFTHSFLEKKTLEDLVHFIVFDRFDLVEANSDLFKILIQELPINLQIQQLGSDIVLALFSKLTPHLRTLGQTDPTFDDSLSDESIRRIFIGQLASYFIPSLFFQTSKNKRQADLEEIESLILKCLRK